MKTHKDLDVWNKAMEFVIVVYKNVQHFPQEEKYGLISQLQRSAVSIPSNIAEGAARNGTKEFTRFLYMALGSLAEVETQIEIARRLGYLSEVSNMTTQITDIRKMLLGLIRFLNRGS